MKGKHPENLFRDFLRVSSLTIFFIAAAFVLGDHDVRRYFFDITTIKNALKGTGTVTGSLASATIFILAGSSLIALGVPRLLASTIGGAIYGAAAGVFLSLAASFLGSSILYLLGRAALADVVERRLKGKLDEWRARFRSNAFWWVLYGRLFPFSNSTVMSLLCGSCKVSFTSYALGSFIGFIPLAIVFACFGSGGVKGDFLQITIATAVLILSIGSRRILNAWFPHSKEEAGG